MKEGDEKRVERSGGSGWRLVGGLGGCMPGTTVCDQSKSPSFSAFS